MKTHLIHDDNLPAGFNDEQKPYPQKTLASKDAKEKIARFQKVIDRMLFEANFKDFLKPQDGY